jgi:beta propeller repeat protein
MYNNIKLRSFLLTSVSLLLLLILVSFTASAASPTVTKTRITTHETAKNSDIYGNTIVWQDYRNGN